MIEPFYVSGGPVPDPMPMGLFPMLDLDLRVYPEEIREALEQYRDDIHSAEDVRRIALSLMERR